MMVGSYSRRVRIAAAATGVMVAGVLAVPAMASADDMDHGGPTTTAAPTTTIVTTTTTTKPTTTTTTWSLPKPPGVLPVHAPGEKITVSGGGCLISGKPGIAAYGIADSHGAEGSGEVEVKTNGSWTLDVAVPKTAQSGPGFLVVLCGDLFTPHYSVLEYPFVIDAPGQPPVTGKPGGESRNAKTAAKTKAAAPKAVKTSPKFTG